MKIILLRPQPGADASAQRAREAGFDPVIAPLFVIEPVAWQMPNGSFDAILISSANAIRHIGPQLAALLSLPVLAVGPASAEAAKQAGFGVAMIGTSDSKALLASAIASGYRNLLWPTGADHIPLGPEWAESATARLTTQIVYRARAIEPKAGFTEYLRPDTVIALHSPRAAQSFADYCDKAGIDKARVNVAAFSSAIADAAGLGWRAVAVAAAPNDASLFLAAQSMFSGDIKKPTG